MFVRFVKRSYLQLLLLVLYVPPLVTVLSSFTKASKKGNVVGNFSNWVGLENYFDIAQSGVEESLVNSLIIALVTVPISLVMGLFTVVGLWKSDGWVRRFVLKSSSSLVGIPDIIVGVSLASLFSLVFSTMFLNLGLVSLIVAHLVMAIPYVITFIYPKIARLDKNLLLAASDLGIGEFTLILKVIVPEITSSLIAASLLVFSLSFDDYIISNLVNGGTKTFALELYTMKKGVKMWSIVFGSTIIIISIVFSLVRAFKNK